jgi:ribonuclease-3
MAHGDPLFAPVHADRLTLLDGLQDKLGHRFGDPALLERALIHASADAARSNERLEFLGDRVLGLVVADKVHALHPHEDEGALTRRVHALVRWEACARVAEDIGLWDDLVLTRAEQANSSRSRGPIMGSACEAVIAALYLDGGLDAARGFIERHWRFDEDAGDLRDPKTRLQEWSQGRGRGEAGAPAYALVTREGPDHAPRFVVEARVPGAEPARGEGGSKREAEQNAAAALLKQVGA